MAPEHRKHWEQRVNNWRKGDVREVAIPPKPGPFRAAAYLIVRTAVELCSLEALTNEAVYGTIDSVALRSGKPSVWPKYGIPFAVKAQGDGEIVARGCYKIGPRSTESYRDEVRREAVAVPRAEPPTVQYLRYWL